MLKISGKNLCMDSETPEYKAKANEEAEFTRSK